jgi:hypothetical protein
MRVRVFSYMNGETAGEGVLDTDNLTFERGELDKVFLEEDCTFSVVDEFIVAKLGDSTEWRFVVAPSRALLESLRETQTEHVDLVEESTEMDDDLLVFEEDTDVED